MARVAVCPFHQGGGRPERRASARSGTVTSELNAEDSDAIPNPPPPVQAICEALPRRRSGRNRTHPRHPSLMRPLQHEAEMAQKTTEMAIRTPVLMKLDPIWGYFFLRIRS